MNMFMPRAVAHLELLSLSVKGPSLYLSIPLLPAASCFPTHYWRRSVEKYLRVDIPLLHFELACTLMYAASCTRTCKVHLLFLRSGVSEEKPFLGSECTLLPSVLAAKGTVEKMGFTLVLFATVQAAKQCAEPASSIRHSLLTTSPLI